MMHTDIADQETGSRCEVACVCVAAVAVEDLQSPVSQLRGYLEALARTGDYNSRLVAAARDASDHVRDIVEALTSYADTDRPSVPRQVDVGKVITAATEVVAEEFSRSGVSLRVGTMPVVIGDAQQLYRAIVALLRAAAKAGTPGTIVSIRALRREGEWQLRLGLASPELLGGTMPVPQAMMPGVDLLTVQRVAEAHGGHVWFGGSAEGPAIWVSIGDQSDATP
jgi:light-regulated signal transduction histidine kinase (bacteriophytochrome)